ncbi:MAG: HIT family protein [Pseudomonadota bacterium]|nr:HIT family protein [Pseudomonadota bacterium]
MPNATELKFGYPHTRVAQTSHWTVLLRPRQPTLGSLVLVCREQATAFSALSAAAFADLQQVVRGVEAALREVVAFERINYLMLMMVDPDVHFHVIPRYQSAREFGGVEFADAGWPGPPALEPAVVPAPQLAEALRQRLVQAWPAQDSVA